MVEDFNQSVYDLCDLNRLLHGQADARFANQDEFEIACGMGHPDYNRIQQNVRRLFAAYFVQAVDGSWSFDPERLPQPLTEYVRFRYNLPNEATAVDLYRFGLATLNDPNQMRFLLIACFGIDIGEVQNIRDIRRRGDVLREQVSRAVAGIPQEWDGFFHHMRVTAERLYYADQGGGMGMSIRRTARRFRGREVPDALIYHRLLQRRIHLIETLAGSQIGWMEENRKLTHDFFRYVVETEWKTRYGEYRGKSGGAPKSEKDAVAMQIYQDSFPNVDKYSPEDVDELINMIYGLRFPDKYWNYLLLYNRVPFPSILIGIPGGFIHNESFKEYEMWCREHLDIPLAFLAPVGALAFASGVTYLATVIPGLAGLPIIGTIQDISSTMLTAVAGITTLGILPLSWFANDVLPKRLGMYPYRFWKIRRRNA